MFGHKKYMLNWSGESEAADGDQNGGEIEQSRAIQGEKRGFVPYEAIDERSV